MGVMLKLVSALESNRCDSRCKVRSSEGFSGLGGRW